MQVSYDVARSEGVEFVVKNEPWTKYKLDDKTLLFARFVLAKVYRTGEYDAANQPIYAWSSQNLLTTIAPKELKGAPSNPPPMSVNVADYNVTAVDFEQAGNEQWNVYELKDGTLLRIKLEVGTIFRTEKFTADGDPFYIVNTSNAVRFKVPPALLRKQSIKAAQQENKIYK
jgi:hypothetical protein